MRRKRRLLVACAAIALLAIIFLLRRSNTIYVSSEINDVRVLTRGDQTFVAVVMRESFTTGLGGKEGDRVLFLFGNPSSGSLQRAELPGLGPLVGLEHDAYVVGQNDLFRLTEHGLVRAHGLKEEMTPGPVSEVSEAHGWTWSFLPQFEVERGQEYRVHSYVEGDLMLLLFQYPWKLDSQGQVADRGRQVLVVHLAGHEVLRLNADHNKRLVK